VPAAGCLNPTVLKLEPSYSSTACSMTSDDKYKLTCLVEGDKNAFPIVISRDADIDQLTELIYEKRKKGLFRNIDPTDLTLLKVCKLLSH
jgi:hypothetical protein